jgi:hypothetical protein
VVLLEFFIGIILSVAVWSTQPLKKWVPGIFPGGGGGKRGRCVGLTTLPPSSVDCLEIWEPRPPGTLTACPGLLWDCFFCVTANSYPESTSVWTQDSRFCHVNSCLYSIHTRIVLCVIYESLCIQRE